MKKIILATVFSFEASDLSDIQLGTEVEFDYGSGWYVHVTPYKGEDAADVLYRAHKACPRLGIDPAHVTVVERV